MTLRFADAIRAAGLTPPDSIEPDGELHRFASNGNRTDDAGWYVFHNDGIPAGSFGCWRSGLSQTWRADVGRKLSPVEMSALAERAEHGRRKREADREQRQADARQRAARIWKAARPARADHAYLVAKCVQPHGIREYGDDLVIPMREGVELHSLQTIGADGDKRFLPDGRVAGCYFSIGKPGDTVCVAEGYATGAAIHEATGHPVAVAFNAGNLEAVARTLRARLPGARIILCGDDDAGTTGNPGRTKANEAARAVGGLVALPDFGADRPEGATDFNDLGRHRGAEAVKQAVARASAPEVAEGQPNASGAISADSDSRIWPDPMDDAAYHGIAGEFVRMVEPDTESDPAALLVHFLVCFGAHVGREGSGPHFLIERDKHHANLYAIVVGESSKARKGTALGRVREVFKRLPEWKPEVKGLSTGEGLIHAVRDAREGTKTNDRREQITEILDIGVTDKRLLVIEPEFARVLKAAERAGNILSTTIRDGWDSGDFRTLTKSDPATATNAHVCIIGHITANELRAELTATDTANGFANRFLFVAAKRSKLLPLGGDDSDEAEIRALADRLHERIQTARTRSRIKMTPDAEVAWRKVYEALSTGGDGLHGAVTGRAETQTIRLALVYCLLDGADRIDVPHLLAALAVWEYCDATARYVFGASLGDRIADELLRRLRRSGDAGMTRTEIRDAFNRHQSADRIGAALELLRAKALVTCETASTGDAGGRPTEVWKVTK